MESPVKTAVAVLGSFALIIALLYFCVMSAAFDLKFYAAEYATYNASETISVDSNELMALTEHMLDFLADKNDHLQFEVNIAGNRRSFFSERELIHMKDVKGLFLAGRTLGIICVSVFIISLLAFLLEKGCGFSNIRFFARVALRSVIALISVLAVLCVIAYLDFDLVFNAFHHLFFSNELWKLDPETELLINIVPLEFFIDIAKRIAVRFSAALMLTSLVSLLIMKPAAIPRSENGS